VIGHDVQSYLLPCLCSLQLLIIVDIVKSYPTKYAKSLDKTLIIAGEDASLLVDECNNTDDVLLPVLDGHTQQ